MAGATVGMGVLLIVLGLGGYFASGRVSKTALIPAFFGVPILVLGLVALWTTWHDYALYGAVALAGLGFLGSARGLVGMVNMLTGKPVKRPAAAVAQSVMALLCLVYAVLGIGSFLARP